MESSWFSSLNIFGKDLGEATACLYLLHAGIKGVQQLKGTAAILKELCVISAGYADRLQRFTWSQILSFDIRFACFLLQ